MSNVQLAIKNFPKQQSIFDSTARFKIASKGRRFGLTKGAANDFIKTALAGEFSKGLWVDVVNSNIDRYIERYFLPHLNKLPSTMWRWRKQPHILEIGKAYIDFRSADTPETLEGFGYDKYFINEAGIVLKDAYLWDNAIRPMFWDYPSTGVIGGTPKGRGKFEELYNRGLDPLQTDYAAFHFTSFDNPYIQTQIIEEDMATMPERVVKQEIYAEFLDDSGVVFRGVTDIANATPLPPQDGHYYSMGVDIARLQDWTVIAVYDRSNNKQVYQARWNKLDWAAQKARIVETSKHFNSATITVDSTGIGDSVANDLMRDGVPVTPYLFTNKSKKELIEKLATYIELKRIRLINIPETINELTQFTYDISDHGAVRYEAPSGVHDDIVMAHALAVWQLIPVLKEPTAKPLTPIQRRLESAKEDYYGDNDNELVREWAQ